MSNQVISVSVDDVNLEELLPALKDRTFRLLRGTGEFTLGLGRILRSVLPLVELLNREQLITEAELHDALDGLFDALKDHPLNQQVKALTVRMRNENLLPNEKSTENLIRWLVEQVTARSVVAIPKEVTEEFWSFFNELMAEPELTGLSEVSLDVVRIFLTAYEPLIVRLVNQLKELRRLNDRQMRDILGGVSVLGDDLAIFRRQIGALRYVRQFFDTDPNDVGKQAEIVASMVREFGPFFIKMAQVAAAGSDLLPEEIAESLEVFQEDVEPMTPAEVEQAFLETYGELPGERYHGFDAAAPLKSGSIASVYLAQKALPGPRGRQLLAPVVIKVGRHNLEREFLIGKTVIKLAILSSQYWAPHSKLSPFLASWLEQVDVFVEGFRRELDFEMEAGNQQRFAERASLSDGWHVPLVYNSSRRIIEMEFVAGSSSLNKAFPRKPGRRGKRARRRVGRQFLHTVISHLLIYREFHGDLHPGNVLVGEDQKLFLIDWGNTVDINELWRPAVTYVQAVLLGDPAAVAPAMLALADEQSAGGVSERELIPLVEKVFADSGIRPVGYDFAWVLYREGQAGLKKRLDLAINLATVMGRQGITVHSDYMHLTRSLTAMVGSFLGIYQGLPRTALLKDVAQVALQFPAVEGMRQLGAYRKRLLRRGRQDQPAAPAALANKAHA